MQFPTILKTLKIYFDLIDWLQSYIFYYVQIITSLQAHKTALLKTSSKKDAQKQHAHQTMIDNLIKKELKIFEILQSLFTIFIFLMHFDFSCCLYINVNTFKQYSFDVIIYYVEDNSDHIIILSLNRKTAEFLHQKIQFILFLSKLLTSVKKKLLTHWNGNCWINMNNL